MNYKDNASLGRYEDSVAGALSELREERVVARMLEGDHTVWGSEPEEIANRLGWLKSPENTGNALRETLDFVETVRGEGIEHVQLLGMGGSSLAPEVFGFALESKEGKRMNQGKEQRDEWTLGAGVSRGSPASMTSTEHRARPSVSAPLRLGRARHLLVEADLTIEEVGRRVVYGDAGYFVRHFRRAHGSTPLGWHRAGRPS